MKIAYILYPNVIVSNRSNGIRSQAETWADTLRSLGHEIDYVSEWGNYDWKSYDAIHLFGDGYWWRFVRFLVKLNPNIYLSPIVDPAPNKKLKTILKAKTKSIIKGLLFINKESPMQRDIKFFKKIFVRSRFEMEYMMKTYSIPEDKFVLVPLSYSTSCQSYEKVSKENFCLHISSIYQDRKNVIRLIEAAKKYGFKLILAGNKGTPQQYAPIENTIGQNKNIEVLGFISEEEKLDLYKRAKVFALPSIQEGVGIVALDAAFYGCEIAITNIPGPKEYYSGRCVEVDPFDIDSIGKGIVQLLKEKARYQPELEEYIKGKYSSATIGHQLELAYINTHS